MSSIGKALGMAIQALLMLAMIYFLFANCVADGKSFLSCVMPATRQPPQQVPKWRKPDAEKELDRRVLASFIKLAPASGLDASSLRLAMISVDEINAASLGNGMFLAFEGLRLLDAAQLDVVVAHELAHEKLGHAESTQSFQSSLNSTIRFVGVLVGADENARDQAADWAEDLSLPTHSREQELEADQLAIEILRKSGYGDSATQVSIAALNSIRTAYGDVGGGFFSSHPAISERIKLLEDQR
jgi:predicted Zn-dependent protease